jgi:hypothetical protein
MGAERKRAAPVTANRPARQVEANSPFGEREKRDGSVNGGDVRTRSKLFDLVFEKELFAFQRNDLEIVGGKMKLFRLDLFFKRPVAAFEFGEMAMHRHRQILSRLLCDQIILARKGARAKAKSAA